MSWQRRWGPATAWAVLIWVFSTEHFSGAETSRIIVPLLQWLLPGAAHETLEVLHFAIRKSAHFIEYFIFSLLVLRGIRGERTGWILAWGLAAVAIAAGYAALDEVHQAFVPGRTAAVRDVLLDSLGAGVAQLLCWLHARQRKSPPRAVGAG